MSGGSGPYPSETRLTATILRALPWVMGMGQDERVACAQAAAKAVLELLAEADQDLPADDRRAEA